MDCLDKLCDFSRQKVSRPKSSIAFSTGIDIEVVTRISNISKIRITNSLERYLGIPSIMGRVNFGQFKHILDHREGRLEGWKAKNLTVARRVVLVKLVLASTPIYMMQSTLLPKRLCNTIDRKIQTFIWSGLQSRRHIHLVIWEIKTRRKANGGLRIRSMQNINLAFMAKLGRRLLTE